MKKKFFILAILVLTIINITAFATLTYRKYCTMSNSCPMVKSKVARGQLLCQSLELTNEQIKEMREMSCDFHEKADSLADKLKSFRLELVELFDESHVTEDQIRAYIEHINSLQKELQFEVISYLFRQKDILTESQQKKFKEMIEQRLKKESIHFKSTGFDFIEGSCSHNCANTTQCDTLNNIH